MEQVMSAQSLVPDSDYGVVEVLDRGGKVVQRTELDQNSLSIGRGYNNDIILDDPYVCLEHVSVKVGDGKLLIDDLDSVNGISQNKYHFRGKQIKLSSNETFRIGHTTLRYRSANTLLQPTKVDLHIRGSFWSLHNPVLVLLAVFVLTSFIFFETIFSQVEETETVKIFADVFPAMVTILGWAGLWALFGKIMIDRISFMTHLGIFSLANIGFYLCSIILGYICYGLGLDNIYTTVFVVSVALITIWMLYTHLSYSTRMSFRSMFVTSIVLTLIGVSFYILNAQVMESEFDSMPRYDVILKSPDFNFVHGDSLESFFTETEELKDFVGKEFED